MPIDAVRDDEFDLFGLEAMDAALQNPGYVAQGSTYLKRMIELRRFYMPEAEGEPGPRNEDFVAPRGHELSPLVIRINELTAPSDIEIEGRDKDDLETSSRYVQDIFFSHSLLLMIKRVERTSEDDVITRVANRQATKDEAHQVVDALNLAGQFVH